MKASVTAGSAAHSVKALLADDFQQVEGGTRVTGDQYVNAIRALHISDAAGTFSFQRIVVSGDFAYHTYDGEMAFKAGGSPATMREQGTMVADAHRLGGVLPCGTLRPGKVRPRFGGPTGTLPKEGL